MPVVRVELTEYNGKHRGHSVAASDNLKPFGVQVHDVFDVQKDLCYQYQPYSGKRMISELEANEEKASQRQKGKGNESEGSNRLNSEKKLDNEKRSNNEKRLNSESIDTP